MTTGPKALSGISIFDLPLVSIQENVYHLPPRILDLLELAAYLYAADRLITRGRKTSLNIA